MGVYVPEIPGIKNLGGDPRELNNEFELRNVGFNFNLCFFQFCFNKKPRVAIMPRGYFWQV